MPSLLSKENTRTAGAARGRLRHHASQCTICRHPQREEIERDFLDWTGPREIAREYGLGSHTPVYRHAHALGLFYRRQHTLPFALGRLIERVNDVKPTAASIISAIRLMAKLNARGEYTEEAEAAPAEEPAALAETEEPAPATAQAAPAAPRKRSSEPPGADGKPARPNGQEKDAKPHPADEYNGPPIAFAQNAGPRHRFFWR